MVANVVEQFLLCGGGTRQGTQPIEPAHEGGQQNFVVGAKQGAAAAQQAVPLATTLLHERDLAGDVHGARGKRRAYCILAAFKGRGSALLRIG